MSIRLSIVIPFFNSMQYIKKLIESIPMSDEIEILIADDKSVAEETRLLRALVAQEQMQRNIYYFYNDEVKSAGTCRNIALRRAVGEWVLFADADDCFEAKMYEYVSAWFDTEYDIVYFAPTSIDVLTGKLSDRHSGCEKMVNEYIETKSESAAYRLKSFYAVPWSKLHRRSFLQENDIWFDEVRAANDLMFSIKSGFAAQQIATCKDVVYCVSKAPGSLAHSVDKEVLDVTLDKFIEQYHYLEKNLPKDVFDAVARPGLNARNRVMGYVIHGYGPWTVCGVIGKLIVNKVPLFEVRYLNPAVLYKAVKGYQMRLRENKNYYKNHSSKQ